MLNFNPQTFPPLRNAMAVGLSAGCFLKGESNGKPCGCRQADWVSWAALSIQEGALNHISRNRQQCTY